MIEYRVPINVHQYIDRSDKPKRHWLRMKASDAETMTANLYEWRDRNHDDGVYFGKTRVYVGMVFPEAAEVVA